MEQLGHNVAEGLKFYLGTSQTWMKFHDSNVAKPRSGLLLVVGTSMARDLDERFKRPTPERVGFERSPFWRPGVSIQLSTESLIGWVGLQPHHKITVSFMTRDMPISLSLRHAQLCSETLRLEGFQTFRCFLLVPRHWGSTCQKVR